MIINNKRKKYFTFDGNSSVDGALAPMLGLIEILCKDMTETFAPDESD